VKITLKTDKSQEQLYNRVLLNFGIAVLAYGLLHLLYQRLYMKNWITFTLAGIFIAAAIVCYVFSKKKPTKNYGHMFLAFGIALLFTRLSVIVGSIIGMDNFIKLQEIYLIKKILQTRWEVIVVVWAGVLYLAGMLIYNGILMYKVGKEEKKNRKISH